MSKVYPLGLVGERNYQDSIARCDVGDRVLICREPDNPYDEMALRVETQGGACIGYVPKSSWLREAIHEQGRGVTATIKAIQGADAGLMGVVIDVTLTDDELPDRTYGKTEDISPFASLVRGIRRSFS